MSFTFPGIATMETTVSGWVMQIEANLVVVATNTRNGVQVAEADINAGLAFMTAHLPQIEGFLQTVATVVGDLSGEGAATSAAMTAVADALALSQQAGVSLAAYNADIAAGKSQTVAYADLVSAFMTASAASKTAAVGAVTSAPKPASGTQVALLETGVSFG